jgi:hypothetical protein
MHDDDGFGLCSLLSSRPLCSVCPLRPAKRAPQNRAIGSREPTSLLLPRFCPRHAHGKGVMPNASSHGRGAATLRARRGRCLCWRVCVTWETWTWTWTWKWWEARSHGRSLRSQIYAASLLLTWLKHAARDSGCRLGQGHGMAAMIVTMRDMAPLDSCHLDVGRSLLALGCRRRVRH